MAAMQESEMHPVNIENEDDDTAKETSEPTQTNSTRPKKIRRLISGVWSDFTLLPTTHPDDPLYCACNNCGAKFKAGSNQGTGNLKRHLSSCVRKTTKDIGQYVIASNKEGNLAAQNSKFNQDAFREILVRIIIRHDLPFSFVEYEEVRRMVKLLDSRAVMISRNTAKADVIKLYKKEMSRIRDELAASPSRICLTSDAWTSIATDGYLSLTAHYVDSNWVLQKKILNFSYFPPPHTGIALAEKITTLFTSWGIDKKLFSITLDNASANDSCVNILKTNLTSINALLHDGILFHVRCCAHILNLIVQDGLKEIDCVVSKIRECVKYVKGSPGRKIKFNQCVVQTSLDSKIGLHQDVPTRWNSTYMMLSNAIYYRRAFHHLHLSDSNFQSCPTPEEWKKVEKIAAFLEVFYNATNVFSGSLYPTSNLYFPKIFVIQKKLVDMCGSSDPYMKKIAEQMFVKFNKYWSEFNLLLSIALVFDPRYKLGFVDFCYEKLYGPESKEFGIVEETLRKLFNEYARTSTTNKDYSSSSRDCREVNSSTNPKFENDSIFEEYDQRKSRGGGTKKSQLDLYLEDSTMNRSDSLDVLEFWKSQQFRFPELTKLARDVLCVPVSTVASESSFSLGGRLLDQYRSSMKPSIVEALVCTRDWLFGETVVSNVKSDEIIHDIMVVDSNDESNSTV